MADPFPHAVPPPDDPTAGRVLVVDDDPSVRGYVECALATVGYAVGQAEGVGEGLACLDGEGFDVVLVDLEMPGRTGLELLDALPDVAPDVVPVLLTGTTDVAAAVGGMKRGALDYLAKPVAPDALRWTVARSVAVARTRRRERALERVVAEWEATFDACPDLILVLDPDGRVLRANAAAAARAGAGSAVGRPVRDAFPGLLGAAASLPGPPTWVRDPASGGDFLVTVNRVGGPAGRPAAAVVVATDVTDLTRSEAARARLLRQLLTAREDEQGRIARELHDGIGQSLVSLAVGVATLTPGPDLADRAARLARVAADALDETRRLARGLRPTVLDDYGLAPALARLTEEFARVHCVRVGLVVPPDDPGRLPRDVESAVYRITQEALTNAAKHARAGSVDVVLERHPAAVRLSVADDGAGFAPSSATDGFGLGGMRERAGLLGGTFRVESGPGRGTVVAVSIPLPEGGP